MPLHASWIHGNAFAPQEPGGGNIASPGPLLQVDGVPWSDVCGLRQGWGVTFRGKGGEQVWFHASVPTPVIEGSRVRLDKVFVLYRIEEWAQIEEVTVWDGRTNAIPFRDLNWTGTHDERLDADNTLDLNGAAPTDGPPILWGVGVSVLVNFGRDANITFAAAGGDFYN
jgi:hypothetical protein